MATAVLHNISIENGEIDCTREDVDYSSDSDSADPRYALLCSYQSAVEEVPSSSCAQEIQNTA
ncbi:hypothetical protein KUTeg_003455 [Tegillarca granosa]|uniref:Uncharacterized protein n=1 Tax=Tegillarca granosa TaxID=220873 RepID=A0ABQ9FM63_TEGGR|nr:hypothetical protein KUTeg_003455 [Tegillarca granosa]